ncbi:DEKNAAC104160 [Brettanomyces naardenensis]|uniref:Dihydrofolate synthetase n=1 Tax=Brettanomyces naardenensis TaxID=13370 RepID=A0A448YPY7_BRENA|nr:DEKNAAC104160 [Brettanomyces naardenensis]
MLSLGLTRIVRLLEVLGNPDLTGKFRAIHIAGTNGKGSICTYLSHILTANHISNGRFTSPHLLTRSDSIQINDIPVDPEAFHRLENKIIDTDKKYSIGCTEFELLTCVAFEVFKEQNVDVAIFEVGLGGKLDATNVLQPQKLLCTGISKIALDHQNLLGNTIEEIALQKLGILKEGVPCVIDASNLPSVKRLARDRAEKLHCQLFEASKDLDATYDGFGQLREFESPLRGGYQYSNLSVALKVIEVIKESGVFTQFSKDNIKKGVANTKWPGRLDKFDLPLSGGKKLPILLDGAHNANAVTELVAYLNGSYRHSAGNKTGDLIYVMAIKKDKTLQSMFKQLFRDDDTVIFTQFKEGVEGMPWVHPTDPKLLEEEAKGCSKDIRIEPVLEDALEEAYKEHKRTGRNVVICGSLYLASDVLRQLEKMR